jgi:hypothetical protein
MAKKNKEGILIIRGITAPLRGRVNGMAELLNKDRDQMVIEWLERETKKLESVQQELSRSKQP